MSTVIQFPEGAGRPLTEIVSDEVRALMGRYGVSQRELGDWLGMYQTAVSKRLDGSVRWKLEEIGETAKAFGVHPAALMGGYAPGGLPDPDGVPILRARRYSKPQPSDPKVLPTPLMVA